MKKGKRTKFLAGILCSALIFADLGSAGLLSLAAEAETVQEMETVQETEEQTEIDENVSSNSQSESSVESAQMQSTENLEDDTEIENQIQTESVSENVETVETELVETETVAEDISESEIEETETQVVLDADGNIASGEIDNYDGHIIWTIDADGNLFVTGTGDFSWPTGSGYSRAPWYEYRGMIKSAKINVAEMIDASYMFYECSNMTNVDLSSFDTSNITYMNSMFFDCNSLSALNLNNFNTATVTNMDNMFYGCSSLSSLDLSNFNTSNVTNMYRMFYNCNSLSSLNLSNFNTFTVVHMGEMFCHCSSLSNLNISSFNTSNVTDMRSMFQGCSSLSHLDLKNFNTSNVTRMDEIFCGCSSLSDLDISNFDTSNITSTIRMFADCSSLSSLNLGNFNTSKVTNMSFMFNNCKKLISLDLRSFDTSNVTRMASMFAYCRSLTNLDLSNFNTSSVTSGIGEGYGMGSMFYECNSIIGLDLSSFDTSNVDSMASMFYGCTSLTSLDLSSFDTSNVAYMSNMFRRCESLISLDLSSFSISKINGTVGPYMDNMFDNCISLSTIYTPSNLDNCSILTSVKLPVSTDTDQWYLSDGTVVTTLPTKLSYSVALGKNYIPKEKEPEKDPTPDTEDESIRQLVETESSIFQFFDNMTGAPIKNGQVRIEEKYSSTNAHYYTTNNNGYVEIPLSKNCKSVFISTLFVGYKNSGGWIDLSNYRSESGTYQFRVAPDTNKYKPKMPSVKASVDTSAPPVETSDGDISMLNMNMNFDLNFGKGIKSKVTYDKNDRTIQVALSTEKKLLDYDLIKHEFKSTKSKTLDGEWETALEQMQTGRASNIDVTFAATGYLEFAEGGDLIEGGFTILIKGQGTTTYRPACTGGVAYAKFQVGLSAEGKAIFTYVDGNINPSGMVTIMPYATFAVGVGWKLAHAEVGATGKIPVKFTFPYKSNKESLSIDAILEVYGETVLLCFGGKTTMSISRNIYPGTPSAKNASFNALCSGMGSDDLEILPRNYLSSTKSGIHTYNAQKSSRLTSSDSFRYSEISPDSGVFKENNVQYVQLSDGTEILAWIHDFGDKSAVNRTTLVYSINKNDGNGWGSITPVCSDTSTGDYYPHMVSEGNRAYLVWNKASKVFDDNVQSDEVSRQIDVYVSVFEDGKFSEPQMISDADNERMEFSPRAAVHGENAAVAWLTNSVNDYHYTKGSNSIYVCEYKDGVWNSPVCYAGDLNYVSDYDIDYVDGQAAIVYAEDADNVSDTQDGTVYYVQNGKKTMIGDASYHAEIVDLCDNTVYFSGGNKVYKASGSQFSSVSDTGIQTDNFSVVKNTSGEEAVLCCQQEGFVRGVSVSYCRNGAYTSPVPIISDGSKVTNFSPVYNNDGTISIAYNEEALLTGSNDIYGLTDMVVKKNIRPNVFFVDSNLSYDAYTVAPGNTVEFSTMARNDTTHAISEVKLKLSGSRSGEVCTSTQAVTIPVGEQRRISLSYTLPETIVNESFTLTVTPTGLDDINLSNNSSKCELGYSDIAVSDLTIENNTIHGVVTNIGYQTAKNVSLAIREDSEENSPISEISYEKKNLTVGERWAFSQEITPTVFESVGDVKYYLVLAETDSLENNYGNDSATVYSEPIAAAGISLDKSEMTLKEKTSATLQAEIMPENATFKNAVYLSSANDIVAVDNNGTVYALQEGRAVVTAYTLDGSQSAQCEITVEAGTKGQYQLSSRGLELIVGADSLLSVKEENGNNVQNVVWSSTDEAVVTIAQDGTVKAVGEGIALLVARLGDFVDVCMVRVSGYSVVLDHDDITICVGGQEQINATVTPSDAVIAYACENTEIATVSETGLVTGVGIGTTVIHVTAGKFTADCRVTVTEQQTDDAKNIRDAVILSEPLVYTGQEQTAKIQVDYDGSVLKEGADYELAGTYKAIDIGEYTAEIKGIGAYTGSKAFTWQIYKQQEPPTPDQGDVLPEDVPADGTIPEGLWIAEISDFTYIGEAIRPEVHVYDHKNRLIEKTDYTITYKNNTNVGEAVISVTGKGNYSGKETAAFTILPADISGDDFSAEDFYVKIGQKAQAPIPQVYYMGTKLKYKKDFTVKYSNASGIYAQTGEHSVTVTGTGNYTGSRILTLKAVAKIGKKPSVNIAKASLDGLEKSFTYTGKAHKQECTLFINTSEGRKTLIEGKDYTVRYINNTKAGTATVIYSGKNGYTGKLKKTYKIVPYNISDDYEEKINCENFPKCVYAKGGSKPKPVITFDGKTMKEGADYTLSYKNNKSVNGNQMPCVVVNGKGSFKGKITINFTISPQDLSKMTLVSGDMVYKNKAGNHKIMPKLMDLDGKLLSAGKDFDKNSITYAYETDVTLENGVSRKAGDAVGNTDILPAGTQIRITLESGSSGNYTGTFTGVCRVVKSDLKSAKVTIPNQTYTGKAITLDKSQITVTLSGTKLKPEDFDIIQYTDNVKKGKATVTIKGNRNYGGTKTIKFNIGTKGFLWWWKFS